MFKKLSEVTAYFKSLRESGKTAEEARSIMERDYGKKGVTGILKEDGETCELAEIEFDEKQEVNQKGFDAAAVKSISDAVTKSLSEGFQKFAPATPIDREEEARAGFKSVGEFLSSLKGMAGGSTSAKLNKWREKSAPTSAMGESSGESGGVLVPPAFLAEIMKYDGLSGVDLLSKTKNIPVSGNSVTIPTNEETPWAGGVQAKWRAEMGVIAQTTPKLGDITLTLNDLVCLVPVGNNLLDDASATSAVVTDAIREALRWKFNEAIITGSGAGMPLGVLNSGALVTVAKTSGQAAATVTTANLIAMYARGLNKTRSAWYVSPQVQEQLMATTMPGAFQPAMFRMFEGFGEAPLPSIFGRPIVELENCSELGAAGDIIFADFSGYAAITKNVQMATSIHMFFDTNATAFRAVARMDGKPWAKAPVVSAKNADFKRSQFVTLAARA